MRLSCFQHWLWGFTLFILLYGHWLIFLSPFDTPMFFSSITIFVGCHCNFLEEQVQGISQNTRQKDEVCQPKKSQKKKSPGITQSPSQPQPAPGEDSVSFERHVRVLKVEFSKTRCNHQVVTELMDRTFLFEGKVFLRNTKTLKASLRCFLFCRRVTRYDIHAS